MKLKPKINLRLAFLLLMLVSTLFAWRGYLQFIEQVTDVESFNRSTRKAFAEDRLATIDRQLEEFKTVRDEADSPGADLQRMIDGLEFERRLRLLESKGYSIAMLAYGAVEVAAPARQLTPDEQAILKDLITAFQPAMIVTRKSLELDLSEAQLSELDYATWRNLWKKTGAITWKPPNAAGSLAYSLHPVAIHLPKK